MSQPTSHPNTAGSNETKTLKESVRPQGEGEENSSTYHDFQESSNSSGGLCHLKWATCFDSLIQDLEGIELFNKFLKEQAILSNFYIACNGFRLYANVTLAKKFYKEFIKGDRLNISRPTKKGIIKALKNNTVDKGIFDAAQKEVENLLRNVYYPRFLKSDIYAEFADDEIRRAHCGSKSISPNKGKQMPLAAVQTVTENFNTNSVLDVSYSLCSVSISTDCNNTRMEPVGDKSVTMMHSKDRRCRQLDVTHNQSICTVDHQEENIKHISMASASFIDSEPSNTDRDEKDSAKAKYQFRNQVPSNKETVTASNEIYFCVAPKRQVREEYIFLPRDNPRRFFELVKEKLDNYIRTLKEKTQEESNAVAVQSNNVIIHDRPLSSNLNKNNNNLYTAEESITRSGERKMIGCHPPTSDRLQRFPPESRRHQQTFLTSRPDQVECLRTWHNASFYHQNSSGFEGLPIKSSNQTFDQRCKPANYKSHDNQRLVMYGPHDHLNQVYRGHHQYLLHAPANGINCSNAVMRQSHVQDPASERVPARGRSNEFRMFRGFGDMSSLSGHGHFQKNSSQTNSMNRSEVYKPPQSRQDPTSESYNAKLLDQSHHDVLGCSSTSNVNSSRTVFTSHNESTNPPTMTTVNYYLVGEAIPHRKKIPGQNVTLKQIKQILPKKGRFRYFFKTKCPHFEAVLEEITDDDEVLPLWYGMVTCKLDTIDDDDDGDYHDNGNTS